MQKNKNLSLAINLMSNILSYSISIGISFILTPFLINSLGKDIYSFYPIANNFVTYITIVIGSLNTMAARYISINIIQKNNKLANKYFSTIFISNCIISLISVLPIAIFVIYIDNILTIPINTVAIIRLLFSLIFASMIVNVITSIFGIATFVKNRIELRSLREIIVNLSRGILIIIFYTSFQPSILYIGIVSLLVSFLNFLIQIIYSKKLLPEIKIKVSYFDFTLLFEVLGASFWNTLNALGNMLVAGTTIVLANVFLGASVSGDYSIANTVPLFMNGIISVIAGVFFPLIMNEFSQGSNKSLTNIVRKSQKVLSLISSTIISVFIGLSYYFFRLWIPDENPLMLSNLAIIIIIPHVVIGSMWTLTNLNVAINKIKVPAILTIVIGVAVIITSMLFQYYGKNSIWILAIITTIGQLIWVTIIIPIYSSYKLNGNLWTFYPVIIKSIFSTFFIAIFIRFTSHYVVIDSWIYLLFYGVVFGFISLVTNYYLLFTKENRKDIFVMLNKLVKRSK